MACTTAQARNIPDLTTTGQTSTKRHDVLKQGFTAVPNALLRHQARLGLTATELVVLLQIWSYWWEEPVLPYPSVSTLGSAMGGGERQIRHLLSGLARRGLIRILPRHSAAGAQVSNAYDLGPLLDRLSAAAEEGASPKPEAESPRSAARVKAGAGEPVQSAPCSPPRPATGDQDLLTEIHNEPDPTIDERIPARAAFRARPSSGVRPAQSPFGEPNAEDPLIRRLHGLGLGSRDRAPAATAMRIRRLRGRGIDDGTLLQLLDEAITALTPDVERPVPYVLAVLEDLAATWKPGGENTSSPAQLPALPGHVTAGRVLPSVPEEPKEVDSNGTPTTLTTGFPPSALWQTLLRHLRGTLAPSVVARLAGAVVLEATPDRLELRMGSAMERAWCERMLRARLETALTELGHGDVLLALTAESGMEETPVASIA
jgi:hypothetical protein